MDTASLTGVGVAVDDDELGAGERLEDLNADVAEAAGADDDAAVAGRQPAGGLRTAWYAVRPASARAATSAGSRESSIFTTLRAEVFRYSAYPPSVSMPGNGLASQCTSSPDRQARHSPQVTNGSTVDLVALA